MEVITRVRSNQKKSRTAMKKSFSDCALPPMKVWLQSQKELCTVSTEELEEKGRFNEVTFLCFADETAMASKEFAAISVELLDLLKSLHLCNLKENEIIFLKEIHKPLEAGDLNQQNCPSQMLCVMRLTPSRPRLGIDSLFTLLSEYAAGIRCAVETSSMQKHISDIPHTEDDDTNHSVSSIEDDFVTALEHLEEDEFTKTIIPDQVTPEKLLQDAASQTTIAPHLDCADPRIVIKSSSRPSALLVNILELKGLPPSVRRSVTTSASDSELQMDFFRPHNSSDQSVNPLPKTLFSSSPAESSESECSSPSPVIFLDEEGYQRSLKAKLQLPKIPVMKDGVEDSDSEVSEFFDSFDQFDEQEQTLQSGCKLSQDPTVGHSAHEKTISCKKSRSATTAMNPQKFKSDRPALPADVRKPTPRKLESSPSKNFLDVPDSPRPLKTSGDDNGGLFSPIRSSAFSPLSNCFSSECLCQLGGNRDTISQNHDVLYHTYSDFANTVSFEILGSVFNSRTSSLRRYSRELSNCNRIFSQEEKIPVAEIKGDSSTKELDKKSKSKQKAVMIKDHIQKFASELVEKSFGHAFKDLQKGVSSCTNVLCHLAAKLTSSAFQMAFYEISRQRAFSLKRKAIGGLAGFLVSEAITGALKELHSMKKQIFTNTVAKFAADLAEELIFEGIMEVCQFSHPSTPTASQNGSFRYDDKVVQSYAEDLSDSIIQEAFIELSQVDVTFTTQAAISVSMNNIKYVSAESILESTQTSSAYSDFHDKVPVALNPVQEFKKEYTIHTALFYTSGIASSVPVPLAGSALCQNQILTDNAKMKNRSATDGHGKRCKDSAELNYATRKRQEEVTSLRSIYLIPGNSPGSECNTHVLCKQGDCKEANNPEISNISHLSGMPAVSNFSGTMVDIIVTEAYEAVTSSKVSKTSEHYTDILRTEKMPYLQCIGEDTCRNVFANYLAKRPVKQSVDKTKSPCSATSEKLAYCVGLGSNKENNTAELHSTISHPGKKNSAPVIVGQQQMPLNSLSKFHVIPDYCNRRLLSGSKDCLQERKWHVGCRFSTCTSPFCSGTFVKCADEFPETERCSAKPSINPLETHDMCRTAVCPASGQESTFTLASVIPNCDDAFHMEHRSRIREGTLCVVPDTPPPTPLTPSQGSSEWNLRNLAKQLKGELAKQFAPATPPSTPYRSEVDGAYENEHYFLEKEEFMLKLMWSLSEEVESSEDESTEALAEKVKASIRTLAYADHLATCIISMATEMAASHLENETVETKNNFQLNMESKRSGSAACMNVSEKSVRSLWIYASDVAGKVISEAKKIVQSRHGRHLSLKQVTHQADHLHLKRNCNECWSKGKKFLLADQRSKDTDYSVLFLPQSSEAPGLTTKFPSCESVTDEYADHIIRILKREGGHGDLIMEQFASRLVYRSIKYGMQQAARKLKMKYNRKLAPDQNLQLNNTLEPFELVNKEAKRQKRKSIHHFGKRAFESRCSIGRTEYPKLLNFSESLACSIASDVRRKFKMSSVCLPKSLTDSCLYKKSQVSAIQDDLKTVSKTQSPFCCKQKLYHSTGSLNECTYRDSIIHAVEQYARKIVDDTLEVSLESAALQTTGNWTNGERSTYAEKLSPFSATACRYCCMKEHQYCAGSPSLHLPGQELHSKSGQISHLRLSGSCQKSHILHLDIPKIHINMDEKVVFAENVIATSFDKAEKQLSNTSLAADSGIGHDGISFADSLTTEIITSCMTNIGQAVNISSVGEEGFPSAESVVSQQMSLSTGDGSSGSWSNLSFDDEQPDENSSFLHLSESLGNSSSWSSLGLEGDMYEENLSFPTSDSDGTEDKEEELKNTILGLGCKGKSLVIINVDLDPCLVDSQLRMTLQWLSASQAEVAELHFHDTVPKEFVLLSKRLRERGWKVGDLFQAVLKYCEAMEKAADGETALESQTLFGWLQDYI